MDTEEERHWLVLHQLLGGSNRLLLNLSRLSENPTNILAAADSAWLRAGADRKQLARRRHWQHELSDVARGQLRQLRVLEAQILPIASAEYPPLLREIPDPPALLYVRGDVRHLSMPALAVVGSRKSSQAGLRSAGELSTQLAAAGLAICSGLALGIDGAAHRAALGAGAITLGVMATGLDRVYPRQHQSMAAEIVERGVLVTEFPLGTPPTRERFPQRNRIISGLSLGVLVVEAALRSGSLITARMALEQNREVFALPHSIYHAQGRGCNALLKEGACLVREVGDILQELRGYESARLAPAVTAQPALAGDLEQVLALLGDAPVGLDELAAVSHKPVAELMRAMTELQLRRLVENKGGLYMRC